MAAGSFVAYYRVSTARQGASGLGLEAQQRAVRDYLNGGKWKLISEFTEVESGKRSNRPQLAAALEAARRAKATLIIARLDRLARNVAFVANLMEAKVEFVAVDMPMANKFTIHVLAAVAEHERDLISQRTKAALAEAKARGKKLGNPVNIQVAQAHSRKARSAMAEQFAANAYPVIMKLRAEGCLTLVEIANRLNERRIPTSRGLNWQATQVRRVIDRSSSNKKG